MDRRTALKNLTLATGYTIAAPSILSVLQSCKTDTLTWTPEFLSPTQGYIVKHLVDIILPTSDLPGGLDVNIPEFIDIMYKDVFDENEKQKFLKGADVFETKFTSIFNKKAAKGSKEDYEQILKIYFDIPKEKQQSIFRLLKEDASSISEGNKEKHHIYTFLTSVRDQSLFGYFTSQKIGEDILAYDPVPVDYIACDDINKLTNDRAWSL